MRKYTYIIFILLFAGQLNAQKIQLQKITGTVKTTDGHPAEFITINLENTLFGSITDEKGNFQFEAPLGNYTMRIFSITAHKVDIPVEIKEGVNNFPEITIIEDKNELEEVVVTGQFSKQSMRNSVYKVKVISPARIQQKAATSLESLLNTEIGIRLSNDVALGETDLELMGMSGNNVKILIDGVPVIDRNASKQSLSQIDINSIERVEIVEGPMSVVYGTDALAGVINIITKKSSVMSQKNTFSAAVRLQEESVGDEYSFFDGKGIHNQSVNLNFGHKSGIYTSGGFSRNVTEGWKGDKTGREKTWQPKDQYLYNASLGYKKGRLNVWYKFDYLNEKINNPSNPREASPTEIIDTKFKTNRFNNQVQADWSLNNSFSVNAVVSYQDYDRKSKTIVTDISTGEKWLSIDESAQDISTIKAWFARATATWVLNTKLSFQPGVEYQSNEGSGGRIQGNPSITSTAIFLSAEWSPLKFMNIRPGLRSIINSDYDAPIAIPSIVTKFIVRKDMDLRLSYAYGFRAPTLRELYFDFHNANHNIIGNPNLKAEYSNNITLGYTWRILHKKGLRLTTNLTGFYNDFRDRISFVQSEDDVTLTTYRNIDKYKTTGGSFENTFVWKDLTLNASFSYIGKYNVYANSEGSNDVFDTNLPKFHFYPEFSTSASYKLKFGTSLNLFYKFSGARKEYMYNSNEKNLYLSEMGSYNWADFTASHKIWKYLEINAGVKNIFNVTTVNSGINSSGLTNTMLVGTGRSFFVGLNFIFNN